MVIQIPVYENDADTLLPKIPDCAPVTQFAARIIQSDSVLGAAIEKLNKQKPGEKEMEVIRKQLIFSENVKAHTLTIKYFHETPQYAHDFLLHLYKEFNGWAYQWYHKRYENEKNKIIRNLDDLQLKLMEAMSDSPGRKILHLSGTEQYIGLPEKETEQEYTESVDPDDSFEKMMELDVQREKTERLADYFSNEKNLDDPLFTGIEKEFEEDNYVAFSIKEIQKLHQLYKSDGSKTWKEDRDKLIADMKIYLKNTRAALDQKIRDLSEKMRTLPKRNKVIPAQTDSLFILSKQFDDLTRKLTELRIRENGSKYEIIVLDIGVGKE